MSTLLRRSRKPPAKGGPGARRDIPPGMRPPPLEPLRNPGLPPARLLEVHRFLRLNRVLEDKLSGLYRQGKITLQELRLQLYRAVEHGLLLPLFSG